MVKFAVLAGVVLLGCSFSVPAFAQKATGEIHGTIFDPSRTVVPKAEVAATDTATGITKTTNSGPDGSYQIPNLLDGTYTISVTATGFQKSVYSGVVVDAGRITDMPLSLKLGTVAETVHVAADATPLETTSNQVATTVRNEAIIDLPLAARDTLTFASLSAGYTPGTTANNGTFNGLFEAALNISLDGTNVNDNRNKSGSGFLSLVPLRLDAVDEVTITTSGLEADAGAGGAMTIQFTTKRGTNKYHGSLFEQFQNDDLNANSFFNNMRRLPIAKVRANDFGGDLGGPLNVPHVAFLKHKLFFFVNFEAAPRPGSANASTTLLTPEAQSGVFRYAGTDGQQHTVNVLSLGGAAGYQSAIDPTVASTLSTVNGTVSKGSVLPSSSNFYQQTLNWKIATGSLDLYPTARLDYQITDKVAWHIAWNLQHEHVNPTGSTYPGLPGQAGESKLTHYALANGVDWSIKPNLYNSVKIGIQSSVNGTNIGNSVHQWAAQDDKIINFGSVSGGAAFISPFIPNAVPEITDSPAYTISDDLSWIKGRHTFKFGGSGIYTRFYDSQYYQNSGILTYTLGIASNDPINSIFTTANIPFINSSDVAAAAQLYATLTGRVSSIGGYNNIDEKTRQFEKYAPLTYRENYASSGLYFQDSFRINPRLTLNYGLRWQFTGVMTNTNGTFMSPTLSDLLAPSYANFQPGTLMQNYVPSIAQRSVTYAPDHINPSPNFGLAWNPEGGAGLAGKLLGHSQTVIRASYSINYFDEGLNDYYWINTNAGNWQQISAAAGSQFAPGSQTLQSADPSFLVAPPAFTPPFQEGQFAFQNYNVGTTKGQVNGSGLPEMKNPYVQSWTLGIQREVTKNTVIEARYVGNKTTHKWHLYGVQEVNIFENGFLKEFQNAQQNLTINLANGVNSFQNRGLPGQVALPIFESAFGARGTQPALASSQGFTSNTFINDLNLGLAGSAASTLAGPGSPTYYCRLVGSNFNPCVQYGYNSAGPYPINFFVPNPYVGDLTVTDDNSYATYNALQATVRHRLSGGLTVTANYTFSKALSDLYGGSNTLTNYYTTIRNFGLNKGPIPQDVRQVFQSYFTYNLPVGKGRAFNISNGLLNRALGGWSVAGIWTLTSGHVAKLTSGEHTVNVNAGTDSGVVLNGLTLSQLSSELDTFSNGPNGTTLYSAARSLIGTTGRANTQYLALPTTPGQFGQYLFVYGPKFFSADMSLNKDIPINDRARFSIQAEFLNFMNHPVFSAGSYNINSTSFGQTSTTAVGPRVIQLRGYLRW
jgi:Carboxypeptidase regulatory-like domain